MSSYFFKKEAPLNLKSLLVAMSVLIRRAYEQLWRQRMRLYWVMSSGFTACSSFTEKSRSTTSVIGAFTPKWDLFCGSITVLRHKMCSYPCKTPHSVLAVTFSVLFDLFCLHTASFWQPKLAGRMEFFLMCRVIIKFDKFTVKFF